MSEIYESPAIFMGERGFREAKVRYDRDFKKVEIFCPGRVKIFPFSLFAKKDINVLYNLDLTVVIEKKLYETTGEEGLVFWCDMQGKPYAKSLDNSLFSRLKSLQVEKEALLQQIGSLKEELLDYKSDSRTRAKLEEDASSLGRIRDRVISYWDFNRDEKKK